MKTKLLLVFLFSAVAFSLVNAQVQKGFTYQAIVRDATTGNPIANTAVQLRLSICPDSLGAGTPFHIELFNSLTTNSFGLINVILGKGARQTGGSAASFSAIDWTVGPKYIKSEVYYGSGPWKTMGASRLWSVPYSMVADKANGVNAGQKISVIGADDSQLGTALFEVKRKDGLTVFAVYPEGVRAYVSDGAKGTKGGFAVGGLGSEKAPYQQYFYADKDSVRVYIDPTPGAKGTKGGFAVGGYGETPKGISDMYFNLTRATTPNLVASSPQVLWYPLKNAFIAGNVRIMHVDSVGSYSTSLGYQSRAAGDYSQAFGYKAIAAGDYSTSIGKRSIAGVYKSKHNAFALGNATQATGDDSYAFGSGAKATGSKSFAFGSVAIDSSGNTLSTPTTASGNFSTAIGMGAQSTGTGSQAFGNGASSSGYASLGLGFYSTATGNYAVSVGYYAKANNTYAHAFGLKAQALGIGSLALGMYAYSTGSYAASLGRGAYSSGGYSTAVGYYARTYGTNSGAFGYNATANGQNSVAVGYLASTLSGTDGAGAFGNNAKGNATSSVAVGYNATTTGNFSGAFGYNSAAAGLNSVAVGSGATTGSSATDAGAFGKGATASGTSSIAIGNGATSSATDAGAFGKGANATSATSMALGASAKTVGNTSVALGYFAEADGDYSFAIGTYGLNTDGTVNTSRQTKTAQSYSAAFGMGAQTSLKGDIAIGVNSTASGGYSTALGYTPTSSGQYSVAIGYQPNASMLGAMALGYSATASANYATSVGFGTIAAGTNATAMGYYAKANGNKSMALGSQYSYTGYRIIFDRLTGLRILVPVTINKYNVADGDYSVAIGNGNQSTDGGITLGSNNSATGTGATAIGHSNTASSQYSFGAGVSSTATGDNAVAFGANVTAQAANSFVIGTYNTISGTADEWHDDEPLFVVGNGADDTHRHDAFIVHKNGYAKIQAQDSTYGLYVNNLSSTYGGTIYGIYNYPNQANTASTATLYGLYTRSANAGKGTTYGSYNYATNNSSNASSLTGSYNSVYNTGTGPTYGDYIYTRSTSTSNTGSVFGGYYYSYGYGSGNIYGVKSVAYGYGTGKVWSGHFTGNTGDTKYQGFYADKVATSGTDLSEYIYDTYGNTQPADVVIADPDKTESVMKSSAAYQTSVVGVITTRPSIGMGENLVTDEKTGEPKTGVNATRLALTGRVPVNVCDENGAIKPGDYLTTSSTPGTAMKWTLLDVNTAKDFNELKSILAENERRRGAIIGKAVESFSGTGTGKIIVLVSLQ